MEIALIIVLMKKEVIDVAVGLDTHCKEMGWSVKVN